MLVGLFSVVFCKPEADVLSGIIRLVPSSEVAPKPVAVLAVGK